MYMPGQEGSEYRIRVIKYRLSTFIWVAKYKSTALCIVKYRLLTVLSRLSEVDYDKTNTIREIRVLFLVPSVIASLQ